MQRKGGSNVGSAGLGLNDVERKMGEGSGGFPLQRKRKSKRPLTRDTVLEEPRAALLAAANKRARTWCEQSNLKSVWHQVCATGHWEELTNRLLSRDEQLLNRTRMNRGLEERRARCREAFEIAFKRAALGVTGRVDHRVVLRGMKLIEQRAD